MTNTEYAHMVVKNFIISYPTLYQNMHQVNHNELSKDIISDWHVEGSIWTHTMMVVSAIANFLDAKHTYTPVQTNKELILAALLHDTGKIVTRNVNTDKQKVTFYGHPGISTFVARECLKTLDPLLTHEQIIYTLQLVNYHQLLFDVTDDMSEKARQKFITKFSYEEGYKLLMDINRLRNADCAGRLSSKSSIPNNACMEQIYQEVIVQEYAPKMEKSETKKAPEAVLLVGLPGAGKSTYVQQYYSEYCLLSRDEQLLKLAPKELNYNEAWNSVDQNQVDRNFEQLFNDTLNAKRDLVIDRTNLTYKGRKKFIDRLRKHGYNVTIVVLFPETEVVYQRNTARKGKQISTTVVEQMRKSLELPFNSEGIVKCVFDF